MSSKVWSPWYRQSKGRETSNFSNSKFSREARGCLDVVDLGLKLSSLGFGLGAKALGFRGSGLGLWGLQAFGQSREDMSKERIGRNEGQQRQHQNRPLAMGKPSGVDGLKESVATP